MRRLGLRAQLTLLYAVPFFLTGAALLAVPLLGVKESVPAGIQSAPPPSPEPGVDLHGVFLASALGLAAALALSVTFGWLVAGRFLRPLRTITATAREISASNLHRRIGRTGFSNEFAQLADTLDDLFERLEAAFGSQRRFVANASHELRTPLTAERTLLQVALADPEASADSLRAACRDVLTLGEAQERLIDALLTLATSERGIEDPEPFDLAVIAGDVVLARREEARRRGIRIDASFAPAPATGNPSLVESLVANLVDNALRHNTTAGYVEISTSTVDERARVAVRNTGAVIAPNSVEQLFQPFRRLDGDRVRHADGHGLGLAIVRAIAHAHRATLVALARPEGGLSIEIDFPSDTVASHGSGQAR